MAKAHTTLEDLVPKIQDCVDAYRREVLGAIGNCIEDCAKIWVSEAVKVAPEKTGEYKNSFVIKPKKRAKFVRYIGNSKLVKAHVTDSAPSIPLINILEYSTDPSKYRPHVDTALENSKDQIINLVIENIGKVGK